MIVNGNKPSINIDEDEYEFKIYIHVAYMQHTCNIYISNNELSSTCNGYRSMHLE